MIIEAAVLNAKNILMPENSTRHERKTQNKLKLKLGIAKLEEWVQQIPETTSEIFFQQNYLRTVKERCKHSGSQASSKANIKEESFPYFVLMFLRNTN